MPDGSKPKEFLNIPVETVSVKTETVYVAKDVKYPREIHLDKIDVKIGTGKEDAQYNLPDSDYGRSMIENVTHSTTVWADVCGNKFGVRDQKGGNLSNVIPFKNPYHENDIDFMGLYYFDEKKVQELIDVSGELRGHGLPVEAIARVDRIVEFPLVEKNGDQYRVVDMLNAEQWKKHLLSVKHKVMNLYSLVHIPNRENLKKTLETNEFYVVSRDMPVAERLSTLLNIKSIKSFYEIVGRQFKWLNVATNDGQTGVAGDERLPKIGRRLDIFNQDDVNYFYTNYLPKYMGGVVAAVHNAGYHMPFAHIQNWTGVGTPVDSEGYRKVEDFDVSTAKKDVWDPLFNDFQTSIPSDGIQDIFDYNRILNKFLLGGNASTIFVHNYLNTYRDRVSDKNLKNVKLPLYYKFKYNLF